MIVSDLTFDLGVEVGFVFGTVGAILLVVVELAEYRDRPSHRQAARLAAISLIGIAAGLGSLEIGHRGFGYWPFYIGLVVAAAAFAIYYRWPKTMESFPTEFPCPQCERPSKRSQGGPAGSRFGTSQVYECPAHHLFRVETKTLRQILDQ